MRCPCHAGPPPHLFRNACPERHFARAADACHITQPTLSAAIRKLEEDLGERSHRFVGLTAEGEKLLAWSRQILTDYHSLLDDLAGKRRGVVGELRLGVIPATLLAVAFITDRFCVANSAATISSSPARRCEMQASGPAIAVGLCAGRRHFAGAGAARWRP